MLIRLDNETYLNTLSVKKFFIEKEDNGHCLVRADDEIIKEFPTKDEACAYLEYICRKMCYFNLEQDSIVSNYPLMDGIPQ